MRPAPDLCFSSVHGPIWTFSFNGQEEFGRSCADFSFSPRAGHPGVSPGSPEPLVGGASGR